jgi:4-hydroxybenzoate polyprenyltransferase
MFLVFPLLGLSWFKYGLGISEFALLVASTVFITIGGNIINDIYDVNADSINKPGKNVVGRKISVSNSWILYWLFTVVGVLMGTLLSYLLNQINYGLIFLFSAGLLWFYSQKYQCQAIVGNLVVAFLSALSFGLVWLFEFFALSNNAQAFSAVQNSFGIVNRMILVYMGFAFMTSFVREIVKDIEDIRGDNRFGCRTFAVVYGFETAKKLAIIVSLLLALCVFFAQYYFLSLGFNIHFWYFFIIDALVIFMIVKTLKASDIGGFAGISKVIKIIMLVGVISILFFGF